MGDQRDRNASRRRRLKKRDRASRVSRAEEVSSRASTTAFSEGWLLYYRRAALNLRGPTPATDPVMLLVGAFSRRGSREPLPGHNTLCLPKAVSGRLVLARVKLLENQLLLRYCL